MKKSNKGFTLVELVVTFAILSVLAVGVGMFVSTGTELYKRVNAKTKLQLHEQVVSQQLENLISPCIKMVKEQDEEQDIDIYRFISQINSAGLITGHSLFVYSSDKMVKYKYDYISSSKQKHSSSAPFLNGVTSFKVTPYNQNGVPAVGEKFDYVVVEYTLKSSDITVSKKQVVNCMNKPVYSNS